METKVIQQRFEWVFSERYLSRLKVKFRENQILIYVNLHQMKCREARKFLNEVIALVRGNFVLRAIHGYNHGTEIKRMLMENFDNTRIAGKRNMFDNPGITDLDII